MYAANVTEKKDQRKWLVQKEGKSSQHETCPMMTGRGYLVCKEREREIFSQEKGSPRIIPRVLQRVYRDV